MGRRRAAVGVVGGLLFLALGGSPRAQISGQILTESGAGGAGVAEDHTAAWDEIDAAIGLDVLWGSINPVLDADPAWVSRPDGKVFLVWAAWDGIDRDLYYATRAAGGTWTIPYRVHPDNDVEDHMASPVLDPGGYLHVAWVRIAGSGGTIMHAVRVGASWTAALEVSTGAVARRPSSWIGSGHTYVTYRTPTLRITAEIILYVGAGVSDDIDPTQVDSEERWHEFVPLP